MRFPGIKEEDGSVVETMCRLCGEEIYRGEPYYRCSGECICEACLEEYARQYFAPFYVEGGMDH